MHQDRGSGLPSGRSRSGEPLIPILSVDDGLGDPVALATWYEVLSNAIGVDIPHDLLGLRLFPIDGGGVLLGPEGLAQDHLEVPLPSPYLHVAQLTALEEVIRRAGYQSALALPVRFGRRDVALLLIADLRPDRFQETEQALLQWAARRLAPMLGRLARLWGMAEAPAYHGERLASLIEALGKATAEATSPQHFAQALSHALQPVIPHDHLELLIPAPTGEPTAGRWLRLSEHAGGPLWTDPALIIERASLDVDALFDAGDRLIIPDTYADRRWPRGFLTATEPAGAELRALLGVRMAGGSQPLAYLLLGSVGPDFYREDEAALLEKIAGVLRARIESFVRTAPAPAPAPAPVPAPPPPTSPSPSPTGSHGERTAVRHPVAAVAELLAATADAAEALALATEEARLLLSFHTLHYALRLMDGDRVVLLEPRERRPLADLPLVPIAGTALARVLHGELEYVREVVHGESHLVVPLRVAGRIHGAVVLTASSPDAFDRVAVGLAQQFADVVAPHIELVRRAALLPPPYAPGWKRSPR